MIGVRVGTKVGVNVTTAVGVGADELGGVDLIHIAVTGQSQVLQRADEDAITVRFGYDAAFGGALITRRSAPTAADPPVFTTEATQVIQPGASSSENIGFETAFARYFADVVGAGRLRLYVWAIAASSMNDHRAPGVVGYPTVGPNAHSLMKTWLASVMPRMDLYITQDGESDAGNATDAGAFEANKTAEIASVRSTFGATVPVVIGELSDTHAYSDQATVIAAQAAVAAAVSGVTLVSNAGRPLNGPDHYTADGYMTNGEALADAALAARGFSRVRWTSVATGRSVAFTYTGTAAPAASYRWTSGDGQTSTAANPTFVYAADGTYLVTCTVTSTTGRITSWSKYRTAVVATWPVDATSARAIPTSSAHIAAQLAAAGPILSSVVTAENLWPCQEASGNLADAIGGKTLTAGNTPNYEEAVADWTSLAVGSNADGTTESFVNVTMPQISTNRQVTFGYMTPNAAGSTNRALMNRGGSAINQLQSSAGLAKIALRNGGTIGTSIADHFGSHRPYCTAWDPIGQTHVLYTELEEKPIVWNAQVGTEFRITCSLGADITVSCLHSYWRNYGASGPISRDAMRALFEVNGFNPAW